ncbi:hypothetical protein Tco_1532660 [Tanacetum coccineum]
MTTSPAEGEKNTNQATISQGEHIKKDKGKEAMSSKDAEEVSTESVSDDYIYLGFRYKPDGPALQLSTISIPIFDLLSFFQESLTSVFHIGQNPVSMDQKYIRISYTIRAYQIELSFLSATEKLSPTAIPPPDPTRLSRNDIAINLLQNICVRD